MRSIKRGNEEVTLQGTLKYSVFLIKVIVNDFWMNSLTFLEPEKQTERRTGELQAKVRPMKSSMSLSAHQSHPYSQKQIPQQRNQNILRTAQKGSSVHHLGRSFSFVPKRFKFTAREVGPADSAIQMHNCGNRLDQNTSNFSTHIMHATSTAADTNPLPVQLPCPAPKYYCIHITVYKMTLGILLIGNAHHRLEFSCWRTKWDIPHIQKT